MSWQLFSASTHLFVMLFPQLQVVCSMDAESSELKAEHFSSVFEDISADDRMCIAEGLSVPEMCLVSHFETTLII
jgi:hypothetical protein